VDCCPDQQDVIIFQQAVVTNTKHRPCFNDHYSSTQQSLPRTIDCGSASQSSLMQVMRVNQARGGSFLFLESNASKHSQQWRWFLTQQQSVTRVLERGSRYAACCFQIGSRGTDCEPASCARRRTVGVLDSRAAVQVLLHRNPVAPPRPRASSSSIRETLKNKPVSIKVITHLKPVLRAPEPPSQFHKRGPAPPGLKAKKQRDRHQYYENSLWQDPDWGQTPHRLPRPQQRKHRLLPGTRHKHGRLGMNLLVAFSWDKARLKCKRRAQRSGRCNIKVAA
jgi:hypothetical protein